MVSLTLPLRVVTSSCVFLHSSVQFNSMLLLYSVSQCINTLALDCLLLKVLQSTVTVYSHGY